MLDYKTVEGVREIVRSLETRGWQISGGRLIAPSAKNTPVSMWSESVLDTHFQDTKTRENAEIIRATMTPEYRMAFQNWVNLTYRMGSPLAGFSLLPDLEKRALSIGSDVSGGFLVPADYSAQIYAVVRERSIIRRYATAIPTIRDLLILGAFDFDAEWVSEVMPTADTSIPVGAVSIPVRKVRAKTKISNDLLSDQPAFLSWLVSSAALELAVAQERSFIAGSSDQEPQGFINTSGALVTNI